MKENKRDMKLTSKVTEDEQELVEHAAARMHMTISTFVRHVVLEYLEREA